MQEIIDQLEAYLDAPVAEEESRQPFVIDSDQKADWAIRKIVRKQSEIEKANKLAAEYIQRVEEWLQQFIDERQQTIDFITEKLRPYALDQLDGKKKTIKLPSGNISFKNVSTGYFINGEKVTGENQLLTEWAKEHAPDFIKVKETTNWADLRKTLVVAGTGKVINSDGEIMDFIAAVEYPDAISVKERK